MNRVAQKFEELRQTGQKALIPYIMGGDPDLATTPKILELLAENGADLIEVGAPFSDPLADGPVIQAAGLRALDNGCTLEKLLLTLKPVLMNLAVPVLLMIYYNMIFRRGIERFFQEAAEAGISGLIIPDLPPDEADYLQELALKFQIGLIFLVAPSSTENRIKTAAAASTGFLYAVSLKGVTGTRQSLPAELPEFIRKVKGLSDKPVAVGFGISTPEQVRTVVQWADGVIIGSAIVKMIAADPGLIKVKEFIKDLKKATI